MAAAESHVARSADNAQDVGAGPAHGLVPLPPSALRIGRMAPRPRAELSTQPETQEDLSAETQADGEDDLSQATAGWSHARPLTADGSIGEEDALGSQRLTQGGRTRPEVEWLAQQLMTQAMEEGDDDESIANEGEGNTLDRERGVAACADGAYQQPALEGRPLSAHGVAMDALSDVPRIDLALEMPASAATTKKVEEPPHRGKQARAAAASIESHNAAGATVAPSAARPGMKSRAPVVAPHTAEAAGSAEAAQSKAVWDGTDMSLTAAPKHLGCSVVPPRPPVAAVSPAVAAAKSENESPGAR